MLKGLVCFSILLMPLVGHAVDKKPALQTAFL